MDCFKFFLGVGSTEQSDVTNFRGAQCLEEDERLRKRVILDGSATGGIRANNESTSLKNSFQYLKFDQQKLCEKQDAINYVNKYKPQ